MNPGAGKSGAKPPLPDPAETRLSLLAGLARSLELLRLERETLEQGNAAARNPADPLIDTRREVRLALVMYGGVSLAIYMNGVSQELFHLVRATAPRTLGSNEADQVLVPTEQLSGTEAVYRKLGQALESLVDDPTAGIVDVESDREISTRFVIDILSGTSAGGINGVFLAKALANGQSIEQLENLWKEEGDISVLLNGPESEVDGLTLEQPPESLLNSGRMYERLLRAFVGMESDNPNPEPASESPYVRELDLWVTTTDLRGVTIPLQIANGLALERRHRNVFHFVYGTKEASGADRNDFGGINNPFLAFVARCTSAFPLAFRPMQYGDLAEPLQLFDDYTSIELEAHPWGRFYRDYLPGVGIPAPDPDLAFVHRSFADGGALDNKPFTWATETLRRRRADVPVDRKLIYVEPDPGHPELERTRQRRPDALENLALQSVGLPRQETIRQDLQALLDRNRTLERVDRILKGLAAELPAGPPDVMSGEEWAVADINSGIVSHGRGYSGYHRLKVASVTDDLSSLVASVVGFDEASDEFLAIRYLVRQWRDSHYEYNAGDKPTFNRFLLAYDLQHRLRRLTFLRSRVDALYPLGPREEELLRTILLDETLLGGLAEGSRDDFRRELRTVKRTLSDIYVELRSLGRFLRTPVSSPLAAKISDLNIARDDLLDILRVRNERGRESKAHELYARRQEEFEGFAATLAAWLRYAEATTLDGDSSPYGMEKAADHLKNALDPAGAPTYGGRVARSVLERYFNYFDDFDMVSFPMLYGTDAGETGPVEIIRISPEDAPSILNERDSGFRKRKTRGWKYQHFGAFLDADWRENDIMFGRLDTAEILIDSLVPKCHQDRDALRQEAQRAIIEESLCSEKLCAIFGERHAQRSDSEFIDVFTTNYKIAEDLEPEGGLRTAGRGVDIAGKVLKGIAEETPAKNPLKWVARLGAIAAGTIETLLPGTPMAKMLARLIPVAMLLEAILIALGWGFGSALLTYLAFGALILTLLTGAAVQGARAWLRGARWPIPVLKVMGVLLVLALLAAVVAGVARDWDVVSRELHSLIESAPQRLSVELALALSALLLAWGNGLVVVGAFIGARKGARVQEFVTLFAQPSVGIVSLAVLLWCGWSAGELGIALPHLEGAGVLATTLFVAAVAIVVVFGAIGMMRGAERPGEASPRLKVLRLLLGTAPGEEAFHRGVSVAIWCGAVSSAGLVVTVNAAIFALWHVAGARRDGPARLVEIIGPGLGALLFLWSRFSFGSLLGAWLFHAATNIALLALAERTNVSTARSKDLTGSTPRSSTGSSTAS